MCTVERKRKRNRRLERDERQAPDGPTYGGKWYTRNASVLHACTPRVFSTSNGARVRIYIQSDRALPTVYAGPSEEAESVVCASLHQPHLHLNIDIDLAYVRILQRLEASNTHGGEARAESGAYPSTTPSRSPPCLRMAATAEPILALDEGDREGDSILISIPVLRATRTPPASRSPFPSTSSLNRWARDAHTSRCRVRAREGGRDRGRGIEAGGKAGAVRVRVQVLACAASTYSSHTPALDPGTKKQESIPTRALLLDKSFVPLSWTEAVSSMDSSRRVRQETPGTCSDDGSPRVYQPRRPTARWYWGARELEADAGSEARRGHGQRVRERSRARRWSWVHR
ncbi:hypothetical protein B0H13DRAFT_1896050 [Mycena leptocephala]|nr:hypothetical protein B0H13DRAFT_1896050 [Mycena leptocephala]